MKLFVNEEFLLFRETVCSPMIPVTGIEQEFIDT